MCRARHPLCPLFRPKVLLHVSKNVVNLRVFRGRFLKGAQICSDVVCVSCLGRLAGLDLVPAFFLQIDACRRGVCGRDEYFERACASGRVPPRKHGCLRQKKQNEGGRRNAACLVVFPPRRIVLSVQSRHWLRFCTKPETSLSLTAYDFCRRMLPVACTNVLRTSTRDFEKFAPVGPPRSPNRERITPFLNSTPNT